MPFVWSMSVESSSDLSRDLDFFVSSYCNMLSTFRYIYLSAHVQLIVTIVSVSLASANGGKPPTHRKELSG